MPISTIRTTAADSTPVPLLRWPAEEAERQRLAREGRPRLLVVSPGVEPPEVLDPLEDWLRDPPDPADLISRVGALGRRAEAERSRPHLDDDGLLWANGRWVVIPDQQLSVAELLLTEANRLVRTSVLTATYVRAGGSGHRASIKTMLNRLTARFAEVGLDLQLVRGKGVLLDLPRHAS